MSWSVVCPNPVCQRKLALADGAGERISCPYCHQAFIVQRTPMTGGRDKAFRQFIFENEMEPAGQATHMPVRRGASWPVWLIGLLIVETLTTVFFGILIGMKLLENPPKPPAHGGDLVARASGPSNFIFKPHSPEFLDDGSKPNEWWAKVFSPQGRGRGVAVSFKIFDENVPDDDALERAGRQKLARLFPEGRFQIQVGAMKTDSKLAGEKALSFPIDITPTAAGEGEPVTDKILAGELRICSRRGIVYWFATWGPEGSREEQAGWDKGIVFGNGRENWMAKATQWVILAHDSVRVRLDKSTWRVGPAEEVKQLGEGRPGILAHADGTVVAERKSKAELFIISREGKGPVERATGVLAEWQKALNGDSDAAQVLLEAFGEEGILYKLKINQKTESLVLLREVGGNNGYLLMGECRFDDLAIWKAEFSKIAKEGVGPKP